MPAPAVVLAPVGANRATEPLYRSTAATPSQQLQYFLVFPASFHSTWPQGWLHDVALDAGAGPHAASLPAPDVPVSPHTPSPPRPRTSATMFHHHRIPGTQRVCAQLPSWEGAPAPRSVARRRELTTTRRERGPRCEYEQTSLSRLTRLSRLSHLSLLSYLRLPN
jgi:hypothetical protein